MKDWEPRFWAKVEKTADCWLWRAGISRGYGRFWLDRRLDVAHRVSYELAYGPIQDGLELDHVCHARACVNPAHLRAVNRKQNKENLAGPPRNSSTGVLGVYRRKRDGRYQARVMHNGQKVNAGTFATLEEAGEAVKELRLSLFTHNNLDRKIS
jgi:hypothetical protein